MAQVEGGAARPASRAPARAATNRLLEAFAANASRLFGVALVALSLFIALETVLRKVASFSFEGADELGGYVLAVGSCLAFVVALVDRAHIRIDVLHARLPARFRALADWLAMLSMSALGAFLVWVSRDTIADTLAYGSTAPTPWATPLIWPQALWFGALCLFALTAVLLGVRATWLYWSGRRAGLTSEFHPRGAMEELAEELQSGASR
ncbi:MAG: TRAP transporter small permease subunit [Rubrimonas sp.]